jgi:hypothetical protein
LVAIVVLRISVPECFPVKLVELSTLPVTQQHDNTTTTVVGLTPEHDGTMKPTTRPTNLLRHPAEHEVEEAESVKEEPGDPFPALLQGKSLRRLQLLSGHPEQLSARIPERKIRTVSNAC